MKPPINPDAKKNAQDLAEKMRRAEDQLRQRREEEKAKKKEKNARLQAHLKEWQKIKEDQELEDHKVNIFQLMLYKYWIIKWFLPSLFTLSFSTDTRHNINTCYLQIIAVVVTHYKKM